MTFSKAFSHKGFRYISFGWSFFIVENLVLSENRSQIIEYLGDEKYYHYIYNSLSTFACSSVLYGYLKHGRKQGPAISSGKIGTLKVFSSFVLRAMGLIGFSQLAPRMQIPVAFGRENAPVSPIVSNTGGEPTSDSRGKLQLQVRCPMDFKARDVPADGIYGLDRVSRHATLWSFGLVMASEALRSIYWSEIAMFSFPLMFAMIGTAHQDSRFRRGMGGYLSPEKDDSTSNVPFVALLTGKQPWAPLENEIKWTNAALATIVSGFMTLLRKI